MTAVPDLPDRQIEPGRFGESAAPPAAPPAARVSLLGLDFDRLTQDQVIRHVAAAIGLGRGGTIVTPNVDICRLARRDAAKRALVTGASLVVPDGVPLLWAARLRGDPLVERITGASLIFALAEAAVAGGWPIYLLGGQPGVAELAGQQLCRRYPGLIVAGTYSPPLRFDAAADSVEALRQELTAAEPRIVFVGLGFPKQELLISRLRRSLPAAWFVGCGAAIPLAAGAVRRAPGWMQRCGLEWAFRLAREPGRLFSRYLIHDLPFAVALLAGSVAGRITRRRPAGDG